MHYELEPIWANAHLRCSRSYCSSYGQILGPSGGIVGRPQVKGQLVIKTFVNDHFVKRAKWKWRRSSFLVHFQVIFFRNKISSHKWLHRHFRTMQHHTAFKREQTTAVRNSTDGSRPHSADWGALDTRERVLCESSYAKLNSSQTDVWWKMPECWLPLGGLRESRARPRRLLDPLCGPAGAHTAIFMRPRTSGSCTLLYASSTGTTNKTGSSLLKTPHRLHHHL